MPQDDIRNKLGGALPSPPVAAVELARKIFRLATHPNTPQHEKEAAWSSLRRCLNKHGLTVDEINAADPASIFLSRDLYSARRIPRFEKDLASVLARFLGCQIIAQSSSPPCRRFLIAVGTALDLEFLGYLFESLQRAFLQAHTRTMAETQRNNPSLFRSHSAAALRRSFLLGALNGLSALVDSLSPEQDYSATTALTILKSAAIDAFLRSTMPDLRSARRVKPLSIVPAAYRLGVPVGESANLQRPITQAPDTLALP